MLEQFQRLYKYRIQFSSDTEFGYVNVTTSGNKNDAINIFLKHCRLKHPVVIDCKFIDVVVDKNSGGGQIGTLTVAVNDETVGSFSGEDKVIEISVPTKMSQLTNDSSYITVDEISEELTEEIKKEVEQEIGEEIETKENKVQSISEVGSEDDYPSTKAVVDYLDGHVITNNDISAIINANN